MTLATLPVRTGRTVPVADAKTAVDIICDIVNHEAGPAVEALRGNL